MSYNYRKLLGRITEKYGTQTNFSNALGLSERSTSLKLNGKVGWKQDEILTAARLLDIPHADIADYFFDVEVQNIEQ
ncbi:MAG: DUF739 family protein [Clostridiales bacterium]|nr:DUF739 family protein [Clostridiales bacterium]